jgi:hypothetical protein
MHRSNIDQRLLDSFKARVNLENGAMDPNSPASMASYRENSTSLLVLHWVGSWVL